jgi:hypothetical protein
MDLLEVDLHPARPADQGDSLKKCIALCDAFFFLFFNFNFFMKKRHFIFLSMGLLCTLHSYSQNDIDAMRYSQLTFGGTARFNSMAGSMGALGGDISTLSFNPAGIGIFRKSELSFSPSIFNQRTSSTYKDVNSSDNRLNFNFGNIGVVATFKLKDTLSGWRSLNFGFGYNRTNNFYNRISVMANNTSSSLLDAYVYDANGQNPSNFDQFSTDLAYQTYLINPIPTDTTNFNHVITNYGELQNKSVETKGSMGETDLSFGGNYRDVLFVGATIGIVNARYIEDYIYTETDEKDTIKGFKSFTLKQYLDTKGNGINFKIGMIIKATDWLRLGAAVHTPTRISLNDVYYNSMSSNLDNNIKYSADSPDGNYNYSITTPFRAMGSIAFIFNKIGLLNAEYEYVNYRNARLSSSPNVFSSVNSYIRNQYVPAGNIRVGGEIRFDPISFRAGYALYGSPFKAGMNKSADRSSYTAGIGFRKNFFFIDFAFVLNQHSDYSYLYAPGINDSVVKSSYTSSSYIVTFGLRF